MKVDDHALQSLKTWFDIAYEDLKKEWITGQYGKISDCPSFEVAATYHEAMTILQRGGNFPNASADLLQKSIDEEIKLELFWKQTKEKTR
ncbi:MULTISPECIES: hypothetical protein [Cytobacillus]|uniref:Uncharacterized protein n=1 Tax=Cytobacillus oceanisediminis TaxID=665099 RepID=A0ABX3CMU5_9BACI|nr:hypothetical protein [Cytobacillus oceanisediminis]EFV74939.1 hypothetical protein HMPREF1013_04816 [Bacillus sp. 2_A_57_CT2]OHX44558.1 hypothetical protein BBV17_25370 [Cytobacillus oceanisediminis]